MLTLAQKSEMQSFAGVETPMDAPPRHFYVCTEEQVKHKKKFNSLEE